MNTLQLNTPMVDDEKVSTWVHTALKLGVPSLIALGLTWFIVADVRTELREARADHQTQNVAMTQVKESLRRTERTQRSIVALLRIQCVNDAKTQAERANCIDAGRNQTEPQE